MDKIKQLLISRVNNGDKMKQYILVTYYIFSKQTLNTHKSK